MLLHCRRLIVRHFSAPGCDIFEPFPALMLSLFCLAARKTEGDLPERLIGSVRFDHLDLKTAAQLDDEAGRIYKNEKFDP